NFNDIKHDILQTMRNGGWWPVSLFNCKDIKCQNHKENMDFTNQLLGINNRPERSKREDLDCCKEVTNLEYLYDRYETYIMEHDQKSSDIIKDLLNKSKMRCSEHCGNTVRGK